MTKSELTALVLRSALRQLDLLQPNSAVTLEQLIFVRNTLSNYLRQIENNPETIPVSDYNSASRVVIEYWPLSLPAGEAVIAAEQAMRKLAKK